MTRYFFDKADVTRNFSKALKHLPVGHVMTIRVEREAHAEFRFDSESSPVLPVTTEGIDVT